MAEYKDIILLLLAYLFGSIPTSVWIGKLFYKIDVREFGSGNAGATNTFRVLGKRAGIPVLIIDILKGFAAVSLAYFGSFESSSGEFINFQIALGISSLLGHIFPVLAGFRGGKGVATLLGVVLAVQPGAASLALVVFLIVLLSFRYVSLASMCAGLSFPIIGLTVMHYTNVTLIAFSLVVAIMLIITHKKNISRLLTRQESKVKLFKVKV
ncbi:MAG: acyl-phosphate glycerol 3-phosphate acyltransferase [Bacteroidetes bacterium]|jgi:glycerol-3-phosphate acyltransferase PlsY|nr:acyl-phosphate glycerol 3-phosphate acyltransferase [Bacteroidota bacterium]